MLFVLLDTKPWTLDKSEQKEKNIPITKLRSIRRITECTHQVQSAAHQMITHTRAILTTATTHENDGVLLDVVALTGDVGSDHATRRETDTRRLALTGVRLLRACDSDLQTYTLLLRTQGIGQGGGNGVTGTLWLTTSLKR